MIIFKNTHKSFLLNLRNMNKSFKSRAFCSTVFENLNNEKQNNYKTNEQTEFEKFKEMFLKEFKKGNEGSWKDLENLETKTGKDLLKDNELCMKMINQDPLLWLKNVHSALQEVIVKDYSQNVSNLMNDLYKHLIFFLKTTNYLPQNEFDSVYELYTEITDTLSDYFIKNNNCQHILKDFSNSIEINLKKNVNIFIFYFYYSFFRAWFAENNSGLVLVDGFIRDIFSEKNEEGEGSESIINYQQLLKIISKTNPKPINYIPPFHMKIINDFLKIFSHFKIENLRVRSLEKISIVEKNQQKLHSQLTDILVVFFFLINTNMIKWGGEASKLMFKLDNVIGDYLEEKRDKVIIIYLTNAFPSIKLKDLNSNSLILPRIYAQLSRNFTFTVLKENVYYTYLHMKFVKHFFKEAFTNKIIANIFLSNIFSFYEFFEKNFQLFKNKLPSYYIFHFMNNSVYTNIEITDKVIKEFDKILDDFDFNTNHTSLPVAVTITSLIEKPNYNFIRKALNHVISSKFSLKNLMNAGFYACHSKIDDFELWKKYFNFVMLHKSEFNNFDKKMLIEMKWMLKLISPKYNEISELIDSVSFLDVNRDFKRWFISDHLGSGSLMEIPIENAFKALNVNFKKQYKLPGEYLVDFLLGENVIVEINGPHHYYINNLHKLNTKSRLKLEIMENMGYHVVIGNILDFEKDNIKNAKRILEEIKKKVSPEEYKNIFLK